LENGIQLSPAEKHEKIVKLAKYGIAGGICLAVSPIILGVVQGMVGLALAAGFGFVTLQLTPWFAFKVANWRMKLITAEAEENPIETLRNDYLYRSQQVEKADEGITEFETEIRNYDDQMQDFSRDYPEDAGNFKQISLAMHAGLEEMKTEEAEARKALAVLEKKIERAVAFYKMALAARKVTALSRKSQTEVFADIKQKVAFDSVRSQLNQSFASLDRAMAKRIELRKQAELPSSN
jgi:hypothetical protein